MTVRDLIVIALIVTFPACAPIQPVPFTPFANGRAWVLAEPMPYSIQDKSIKIVVPKGFVTDFASIPSPFWPVLNPYDTYHNAAVVHDYLYWTQICSREESDKLLMLAMEEDEVNPIKRWLVYRGVRLFGQSAWEENARDREQGLPRLIPDNKLPTPPLDSWDTYRKALATSGVHPESRAAEGVSAEFCGLGSLAGQ